MEQLQRGKGVVRDSMQGRFPTQPLSNPRNLYVSNTVDESNASSSYSSSREVLGIAVRDGETLDQKNGNVERLIFLLVTSYFSLSFDFAPLSFLLHFFFENLRRLE